MSTLQVSDMSAHESPQFFTADRYPVKPPGPRSRLQQRKVRTEPELVLVVDDDHVIRKCISMILQKAGYRVVTAENGEEALGLLTDHQIDVVVSDVIMPIMNGMEMYLAIKKIRPDLHVIFASGYSSNLLNSRDMEREDLRFLQKPVMKDTLLQTVREVLDLQE